MATIDSHSAAPTDLTGHGPGGQPGGSYAENYQAAHHFRDRHHEFDAVKMGVWLFLATEILLFSGMFVAYAVLRLMHPEAFAHGSHLLDVRFGLLNTVILLISSYTVASAVRHAQTGNIKWLERNIIITFVCGLLFMVIKFVFEYGPKIAEGKLPGKYYSYPYAVSGYEPLWWGVYYGATGIHASHVIIGMGLFAWLYWRTRKGHFGPRHYNAVEGVGLYWHIVDIVWIFLFPLLYLIH
jgi:cytochrome c oxidase subunit III